jgi:hypothetical protein
MPKQIRRVPFLKIWNWWGFHGLPVNNFSLSWIKIEQFYLIKIKSSSFVIPGRDQESRREPQEREFIAKIK